MVLCLTPTQFTNSWHVPALLDSFVYSETSLLQTQIWLWSLNLLQDRDSVRIIWVLLLLISAQRKSASTARRNRWPKTWLRPQYSTIFYSRTLLANFYEKLKINKKICNQLFKYLNWSNNHPEDCPLLKCKFIKSFAVGGGNTWALTELMNTDQKANCEQSKLLTSMEIKVAFKQIESETEYVAAHAYSRETYTE